MKTNYSRVVEYTPEWNGNLNLAADEQLKFEIMPTEVGVFNELIEVVGRNIKSIEVKDLEERVKLSKPFAEYLKLAVPPQIKSVGAPLRAQDGSEIAIEEVCSKAALIGLASELMLKLIDVSKPTELDVKN